MLQLKTALRSNADIGMALWLMDDSSSLSTTNSLRIVRVLRGDNPINTISDYLCYTKYKGVERALNIQKGNGEMAYQNRGKTAWKIYKDMWKSSQNKSRRLDLQESLDPLQERLGAQLLICRHGQAEDIRSSAGSVLGGD